MNVIELNSYQDILEQTWNFIKEFHQLDYSGHDFEHICRVWNNAQKIIASEPSANYQVVELAVLLHDVDDYKLVDSFGNAKRHLEQFSLPNEFICRVVQIIDSIGFSKTGYAPKFDNIESKIVYDADKLDAIGSVGIARAFAFGGAKSRSLFERGKFPCLDLNLLDYAKNAKSGDNHTINHFFDKLLKLSTIMQTKLGQELAKSRQNIMLSFLENFFMEQGLENWLNYLDDFKCKL